MSSASLGYDYFTTGGHVGSLPKTTSHRMMNYNKPAEFGDQNETPAKHS